MPSDAADLSSSTSAGALLSSSNASHMSNNHSTYSSSAKSIRRFPCTVCNVDLPDQKLFSSHLNSRLHQQTQSIHDVLQSVAPEYRAAYKAMLSPEMLNKKVFNRELLCDAQIRQTKEPLLGLGHIVEFQFENVTNSAQYVCELCQRKCSLQSIVSHIVSIQHQRKFLKMHEPDVYDRVLSAYHIRSEEQRLIGNYAKQIQSRHGGPGSVRLHVQLESFIGQKPLVLAVSFESPGEHGAKGSSRVSVQLSSKTFEDYDYPYDNEPKKNDEGYTSKSTVNGHHDSVQHGLTSNDLLYPFDRQFWYQNYKDLLESRPIDPHSVTYQEILAETNNIQPFRNTSENNHISPVSVATNGHYVTLENGQTIRRNSNQPSNRRVILDTNRTPTLTDNGILRISPSTTKSNFDGYTLLNEQQKKTNGSNAVLNEESARAILAASGLLQLDDEDERDIYRSNFNASRASADTSRKSDKMVSPLIAKRMLDAVLNGELDVAHIQPYFSTFVHLIQSGQIELERQQAERLLHKVLVTSSSAVKDEPVTNGNKRVRSPSPPRERRLSSSSRHRRESDDYRSSTEYHSKRHFTPSSTTRRVHLTNENRTARR